MTRITIEVDPDQKMHLKAMAALNKMTIKDFILDRTIGLEPNEETLKSFDDYKKGKGLTKHSNLNDLIDDLNS